MASPTQLNATEQDTLVKQIGLSLLRAAPRDWRRVTVDYRAVGRYHELNGEVALSDGTTQEWVPTHDVASLFGRLRTGMYREGRGTWFNARYQLDHPSSYNLEYDRDEPTWDLAPPPQAYADELRMFPRNEENVPDWLMRRMAGLGPERPGPRFRMARVFDAPGAGGRPVVNRPKLDTDEQDRVLEYLDSAPVVVPGRGYDLDRLANTPESTVPIAFHSDGTWIWPAAVNYYLRQYGVSPDLDLVDHIRASGFVLPDVPDAVRHAAAAHVSRGTPPQRPPAPEPGPAEPPTEDPGRQLSTEETAERPPRFEAVPAEHDAERTQLASPVPSAPPPDFEDEPRHEDRPDAGFTESDAERTRIAVPPRFTEEDTGAEKPDYADEPYDERNFTDDRAGYADYHDVERDAEPREDFDDRYEDERHDTERAARTDDLEDTRAHPESPADQATTYTPVPPVDDGPPTTITPPQAPGMLSQPPQPVPPVPPAQEARLERHAEPGTRHRPDEQPAGTDDYDDGGPPTEFSAGPLVYDEPVFEDLHDRLEALGVPTSDYRIGEPAERGWALEEAGDGWRVGWYEGSQLTSPAMFGDAEDAAAFMLGKLLLAPEGIARQGVLPEAATPRPRQTRPGEDRDPHRPEGTQDRQPPPPQRLTATLSSDVATGIRPPTAPEPPRKDAGGPQRVPAAHSQNGQAAQGNQGNQQWPIQPLQGEPPLTLFRGKEMRDLPVGSELDRFGGPSGNLTYAAGTPFEERSLVPEWVNRPYHVYRVQRPLRALAGVAIPWFNQPGGGAAYLLPASIDDLLADGDLIELEPGEPPVD